MKQTIAIDLDDVVADSTEALRLEVNRLANVELTKEDYRVEGEYWGYYEKIWQDNKIDHVVSFKALRHDMSVSQDHIGVAEGAREVLLKLKEKYHLVVVTARFTQWVDATHEWIETHLPDVFDEIVFVHHDVDDGRTKGDACLDIGATWLIDDNVAHCQSAKDKGVKVILFGDYGWSKVATRESYDKRCLNWQDVLECFEHA